MVAYQILVTKDVHVQNGVTLVATLKSNINIPYKPLWDLIMGIVCVNFYTLMTCRFPLKAVKVMHTVALRTEATISCGEMPPNLGQAFKVI